LRRNRDEGILLPHPQEGLARVRAHLLRGELAETLEDDRSIERRNEIPADARQRRGHFRLFPQLLGRQIERLRRSAPLPVDDLRP
jgi:hypothetical protein